LRAHLVSGHAALCFLLIFDLDPIAGAEFSGPFRRRLKGIEEGQASQVRLPRSMFLHKSSRVPCEKRFTIIARLI
jgi:hypothetical protein